MNVRIKKWLQNNDLKASVFADKIGVNRATVSHILSGRNKPSIDFIEKMIRNFPDLNSDWLLIGEGFMLKSENINLLTKKKSIEKILIFYDDSSFEELKP